MTGPIVRLFVSSPGDVADERRRIDLVVERLNAEFEGRVKINAIRWETSYYSSHDTFQKQIPEAAECDVVLAVFRARLGTPLPPGFPVLPSGEPYPSGTAYEVLTAIEARKAGKQLPDVYVFRYPEPPSVRLDDPASAQIKEQWDQLKGFFDRWFRTQSGEFIAAFQTYDSTDDFAEKIEACLRQWLARRGFVVQEPVWDRVLKGSPFPGLSAFEADHGAVFFGRELAIAQSLGRLHEADAGGNRLPFLLVIGASGSGKSSLLRAGLLPALMVPGAIPEIDLWRSATVTPGPNTFLRFAEALFADAALGPELRQGTFRTKELLAKQLAGDVDTALAPLRDALERAARRRQSEAHFETARPVRLALAIDQAERLFVEAEPSTVAAFAELIAALLWQKLAYVIVALRSDAYARFQGSDTLVGLRESGATFDLVPPSAAELEEIVTRPVEACRPSLTFEQQDGRSLAALLVADAKGGDALPLLQMTLSRLYAAEAGRGDGVLRYADYRGMDAAVTEAANDVLATLQDDARAELPALIAGLVNDIAADPLTGAPLPVVSALDRQAFEAQKPFRKALVAAFVDKRLLTTEGDGVFERVRPVHEALLRIWPEAVAIIAEMASLIRVRHALEPIVREWVNASETGKSEHLEISPALLDGAQQLVARLGDDLPASMRDFIAQAAAVAAARRDRERQAQERRIRDAEALAFANRRIAQRTRIGFAIAVILAAAAGAFGAFATHEKAVADQKSQEAEAQRNAAEAATRDARAARDRAEQTLALATKTANDLVFNLAIKFRHVVGVPTAVIKDILDRARHLQDELLRSGDLSPDLQRSQAIASYETAATLLDLGQIQTALASAKKAQQILEALLGRQPNNAGWQDDLSNSDMQIGDIFVDMGDLAQALKFYRASLGIMGSLAKSNSGNSDWRNNLSISYEKVGNALVDQGNLTEALKSYRVGLAIMEHLGKSNPDNAQWQRNLTSFYGKVGEVELRQGDKSEALKSYQAGLAIARHLAESDPGNTLNQRNLALSYDQVREVQMALDDLDAALTSAQASLGIERKLAGSDPANDEWQRELAASHSFVGEVQVKQGNLPDALKSYQASFAITERLAKSDPDNANWQEDLSVSYEKIGDVELGEADESAALQSYQASLDIRQRLAKSDPGNASRQHALAVAYRNVGEVLVAEGDFAGALNSFAISFDIIDRLVRSDPANTGWQKDLVYTCEKLADAYRRTGDLADARASFFKGRVILARLVEQHPDEADWKTYLAWFDRQIASFGK